MNVKTDWFERLTGFRESGYEATRARLEVRDNRLRSLVNGRDYGIGRLELASLAELRQRVVTDGGRAGRLRVRTLSGDVRALHQHSEFEGALFQVASQFNMLEMVAPNRTPEDGVTDYAFDRTQGPACAIAAGAATIYRNYLVPVGEHVGQTTARQLDGLQHLGDALAKALGTTVDALWTMRNGYALPNAESLAAIEGYLAELEPESLDSLREKLRIGLHWDVEVTDTAGERIPVVSQAFCSALPVAYTALPKASWEPFARLVLEAAYEATLWAGVIQAGNGGSEVVLLTFLGGGAFGNADSWIHDAIRRALRIAVGFELDVRLVCYGAPSEGVCGLAREFE